MAGVVIGSLITKYSEFSPEPKALAVTVNNSCNLKCPHCYLQYNGVSNFISVQLQEKISNEPCEHVAIVGMEPLRDRDTIENTFRFVSKLKASGKTVSIITNGMNLHLCEKHDLEKLDFVDVSLDGGERSFKQARGVSFSKLVRNLKTLEQWGIPYNILNTVYSENAPYLDDMVKALDFINPNAMYFSPYIESINDGVNSVNQLSTDDYLRQFSTSEQFLNSDKCMMLFDRYHCDLYGVSWDVLDKKIHSKGLKDKCYLVPHTPLSIGILRVTYDGRILSPEEGMHPKQYSYASHYDELNNASSFYSQALLLEADRKNQIRMYAAG